jgi:hypothetical protein
MNAIGSFYSVGVLNQPKKIRTVNTKQTKYLRSVPQESIVSPRINPGCIHLPQSEKNIV